MSAVMTQQYASAKFPTPREFQKSAREALRKGFVDGHRCQMVMAPTGCHARGELILMANGRTIPAEAVRLGDRLLGDDGGYRTVLALHHGIQDMACITPIKGEPFTVNVDHILSLVHTQTGQVVDISVRQWLNQSANFKRLHKLYRAAVPEFETHKEALLVHPWLLGVYLGDGSPRSMVVTNPEPAIQRRAVELAAHHGVEAQVRGYANKCESIHLCNRKGQPNPLRQSLKSYGLGECDAHSKFVPREYLVASIADRAQLLAGLLDTDGHYSGGGYDYVSASRRLANDVVFLARSLGLAAYMTPCRKGCQASYVGDYFRVSISGDFTRIPCIKHSHVPRRQIKSVLRTGFGVEVLPAAEYFGWEVDGNQRYLMGDFTVTHNSGKTILSMFLIQESLLRNKRVIFVADRRTLINQTSEVADSLGLVSHGVMMSNHWRFNPSLPFQIASAQTLARREWPDVDLIIVDECFAGETLVSTPDGQKRIADVRAGDLVFSACGLSTVKSVFSKKSIDIYNVRLSDGTKFECTGDHPIFTENGWTAARAMGVGSRVFGIQDVQDLWNGIQPDEGAWIQRENDFRSGSAIYKEAMLRKILRKEIEKSDARSELERKNVENAQSDSLLPENSGREWKGDDGSTASGFVSTWAGVDAGIYCQDKIEASGRISAPLQTGYCKSGGNDCNRIGRAESFRASEEGSGQEEGLSSKIVWVESVTPSESGRDQTVFNLRVSGHPSYFANGVLVHNCHTQLKAWTEHLPTCRAAVIGLSATPFSDGLGKLFTNLVNATTMRELTESGVLVPMRVLSCTKVNMKDAATANGEWTDRAAQERGMEIVGDVVHEWIKHGENRKTIVFGATIAHCEAMAREFNDAGVMAAVFTSETTEAERKVLLDDFKKTDSFLKVLISVEALAKGFDQKDVSCICDVRPLRKSLSTAIQMWGRGLRSSPETDKKDMILLDFSGNIVRFSEDFESIYHDGLSALDMGEKLDKAIRKDMEDEHEEPAGCPQCGYKPFKKRCMACGHEIVKQSLIEHEAGEMVEFKIGKATVGDKLTVWEQAVTLCRNSGKPETAKGRAAHLYKSITGVFPRNLPEFDAVPNVPISRAVMNKQKANLIAYRSVAK